MLYAIYAYEQIYGGLHGMNSSAIVECESLEDVDDIGLEMAMDVIDSYNCILDSIRDEASEIFEKGSKEWHKVIDEIKRERAAWDIFEIEDSKGKSIKELEEEFYNNKSDFIRTYCRF